MSNEQQQCRQIVLPDVPEAVTSASGEIWRRIFNWSDGLGLGNKSLGVAVDSAIVAEMRAYATEAVRQDRASRPVEATDPKSAEEHAVKTLHSMGYGWLLGSDGGKWTPIADDGVHDVGRSVLDSIDRSISAIRTLEHLGYTWNGGELWKPPVGPAKPAPWYPDDSGQWVEVAAGPAAIPADVGLDDDDKIEVLVETERRYRSYQKRAVAAAAEWFHGDSDFSDFTGSRIVAYKLVEKAKPAPDAAAKPAGPAVGQTWWVSVKGKGDSSELSKALVLSISDQVVQLRYVDMIQQTRAAAYRRSAVEFVEVCNG